MVTENGHPYSDPELRLVHTYDEEEAEEQEKVRVHEPVVPVHTQLFFVLVLLFLLLLASYV